jgi:hypothetical protein
MISSGFAAVLILSIISKVETDFPAVFSMSAGNWTEMLTQASGFKYKFWDVLMTTASLQSSQGNIDVILTKPKYFHVQKAIV